MGSVAKSFMRKGFLYDMRNCANILKVWWHDATLFVYFSYLSNIHSFNHIHTIHISVAIRWGLSPYLHRLKAKWEKPPCGAEPRIELGPAVQQADVLPTEPR